MGFAFAGNVLSGQFAHALAGTCLQNLAAPDTKSHPDVEDIAKFYSTCAVKIYEERRRHHAVDSYGFEGVVFGYSKAKARSTAYHFVARVAADGTCEAPVKELDLVDGIPFPLGSGALAARTRIEQLVSRHIQINPFSLIDAIIRDPTVTSVGGEFQAATASISGVELRPIMFFHPTKDGGMDADFSVMGININHLGMVAGFVPVGTPMMAQRPDDLTYISKDQKQAGSA